MNLVVGIFAVCCIALCAGKEKADDPPAKEPVVGHWNATNEDGKSLCIKMDGAIRLTITYETKQGTNSTATIVSEEDVVVEGHPKSYCKNSSKDLNESLALKFNKDRLLTFYFTRDPAITGDSSKQMWQLNEVQFEFKYDSDFPDAKKSGGETLVSDAPLKDIHAAQGRSFSCKTPDPLKVTTHLEVNLYSLRVQPFITGQDFGQVEWCGKEQTSDLIPIIIGAALAALVIIVLIAYLVGRARQKTTTYDNI